MTDPKPKLSFINSLAEVLDPMASYAISKRVDALATATADAVTQIVERTNTLGTFVVDRTANITGLVNSFTKRVVDVEQVVTTIIARFDALTARIDALEPSCADLRLRTQRLEHTTNSLEQSKAIDRNSQALAVASIPKGPNT